MNSYIVGDILARSTIGRLFHIDPYNYALGLAALAEKAGARIFEDTPAVSF